MPRSCPRLLLAALALALALVPAALRAQTVSGTVIHRETGAAVAGAVVRLVDAAGTRQQAVLSDARGRYTVQAPRPGTYRLIAERVGYAASTSSWLQLGEGQHVEQRVGIGPSRVLLDMVVGRGRPRACTIRPENGTQASVVWNEARKALESAELGARHYDYRVRLFRRTLALPELTVRDSASWMQSGLSRQPFATPLERLVSHGYVENEGDSIVFRAPDAPTLLSDAFLDHHCFSLRRGQGETAGLVGLVFAPLRDRRLPDVRGTLWLERETGHLRYVDYSYTGLPFAPSRADLGGRLEFVQVADGGWIVNRWTIRMPVLARQYERMDPVITALVESGGEVLDIRPVSGATGRPRPAP
jgi:hypothetical protein